MTVHRMDNVSIVVEDLDGAVAFFVELGLELAGKQTVEGDWVDQVIGLQNAKSDIAMMRTPDRHSQIELTKYHSPKAVDSQPNAPANALGIRRVMFAVDDIDDVIARLKKRGATLVGTVARYKDVYRLCYLRGPEGIIVALAEAL